MPVNKDALDTVPASAIEGVFYRLISERYQNEPLSMFGAFKEGRRYNVAQTFGALYLGFDKETCQAEILGAPILAGLLPKKGAYVLWDYDASLNLVVRLDDTQTCTTIGVTQAEITVKLDHQWASSIALPLFRRRIEGVVAPSAQKPDGKCLDVFLDNVSSPSFVKERGKLGDWP
jgi:RES domain-containing protein